MARGSLAQSHHLQGPGVNTEQGTDAHPGCLKGSRLCCRACLLPTASTIPAAAALTSATKSSRAAYSPAAAPSATAAMLTAAGLASRPSASARGAGAAASAWTSSWCSRARPICTRHCCTCRASRADSEGGACSQGCAFTSMRVPLQTGPAHAFSEPLPCGRVSAAPAGHAASSFEGGSRQCLDLRDASMWRPLQLQPKRAAAGPGPSASGTAAPAGHAGQPLMMDDAIDLTASRVGIQRVGRIIVKVVLFLGTLPARNTCSCRVRAMPIGGGHTCTCRADVLGSLRC